MGFEVRCPYANICCNNPGNELACATLQILETKLCFLHISQNFEKDSPQLRYLFLLHTGLWVGHLPFSGPRFVCPTREHLKLHCDVDMQQSTCWSPTRFVKIPSSWIFFLGWWNCETKDVQCSMTKGCTIYIYICKNKCMHIWYILNS